MKSDFEKDSERHLALSEQYHPTNIQTNLKVAVMEADEESEKIAESFLDRKFCGFFKMNSLMGGVTVMGLMDDA